MISDEVEVSHPSVHLLCFGAGDSEYTAVLERISENANQSRFFLSITALNQALMDLNYPEFGKDHGEFIEKNRKGYGRWIWKPFIIYRKLLELPEDSILLYLDAGSHLNFKTKLAHKRMQEYVTQAEKGNIFAFQHQGDWAREKAWTRVDLVAELGLSETDLMSGQNNAGVIFFKVSEFSVNFAKEWFELLTKNSYQYSLDPAESLRFPDYVDHRHDQSVFSGLIKKYQINTWPEQTWFPGEWEEKGSNFPIWQKRDRPNIE